MIADLYIFICFLFNVIKKDRSKSTQHSGGIYYSKAIYYVNNRDELHRDNGPAIIIFDESDESKERAHIWYKYNERHRKGGPAVEYSNGGEEWWLNGIQYKTKDSYFHALSYEGKKLCLISEDFLNA